MAHTLLHMQSFDALGSMSDEYTAAEYSFNFGTATNTFGVLSVFGYGRFADFRSTTGYIAPLLPAPPYTTLCVSGHFCFSDYGLGASSGETTFIQFWDGSANAVQVEIRAAYVPLHSRVEFRAYRGTTLIATSSMKVSGGSNNWTWLSVLVTVNSSTGRVKMRIGPASVLDVDFTGNTQNTANTRIDQVRIGRITGGSAVSVDNFFITSALSSDTPLTERRIHGAILPTGNETVQWTPSTGTNWQNVDDATPGGDTDYNSSNTSGQQDTFVTSWPTVGNTIHAVKSSVCARKDDAGTQNIQHILKIGSTSYASGNKLLGSTYIRTTETWLTNPATTANWAQGDFNSSFTFGYKVA
jgi:hypothetical protein